LGEWHLEENSNLWPHQTVSRASPPRSPAGVSMSRKALLPLDRPRPPPLRHAGDQMARADIAIERHPSLKTAATRAPDCPPASATGTYDRFRGRAKGSISLSHQPAVDQRHFSEADHARRHHGHRGDACLDRACKAAGEIGVRKNFTFAKPAPSRPAALGPVTDDHLGAFEATPASSQSHQLLARIVPRALVGPAHSGSSGRPRDDRGA